MIRHYFLWGLLGAVAAGLTYTGTTIGMKSGDWAAWTGAFGTVATLAMTIWLATESERSRKREELDLALITAAEFALRIPSMQITLRAVRDRIPNTQNGRYSDVYQDCYEQIHAEGIWTSEELKPLVAIPDHTAARLAFVLTRIRSISTAFIEGRNSGMQTMREVEKYNEILTRQLNITINHLDNPRDACLSFLARHGFRDIPHE